MIISQSHEIVFRTKGDGKWIPILTANRITEVWWKPRERTSSSFEIYLGLMCRLKFVPWIVFSTCSKPHLPTNLFSPHSANHSNRYYLMMRGPFFGHLPTHSIYRWVNFPLNWRIQWKWLQSFLSFSSMANSIRCFHPIKHKNGCKKSYKCPKHHFFKDPWSSSHWTWWMSIAMTLLQTMNEKNLCFICYLFMSSLNTHFQRETSCANTNYRRKYRNIKNKK